MLIVGCRGHRLRSRDILHGTHAAGVLNQSAGGARTGGRFSSLELCDKMRV